jgi:P-type Cu+ transporter
VLLTGENAHTARAIEVGIDDVIAEVLPADKAAMVHHLQGERPTVAMVREGGPSHTLLGCDRNE